MDIAPGVIVANRFRLLQQVGKGGMGSVWKSVDQSSNEIVALKLLHPHLAQDEDYLARFEREVEISQRIISPNVVQVSGFGRSDGVPFIAMEFVNGESLRERLQRTGPMEWRQAAAITRQILAGLGAAHDVNVLHRDIKPGNILLSANGTAKIADFGIAKATDLSGLTGSATMLGTPAYMAPDREESRQSDLYSLGCVIFEMLTGAPPYEGTSLQSVIGQHWRDPPNIKRLPPAAWPIVTALLEKNASQRPRSAAMAVNLLDSDSSPWARPGTDQAMFGRPAASGQSTATETPPAWVNPMDRARMARRDVASSAVAAASPRTAPHVAAEAQALSPSRKRRAGKLTGAVLGLGIVAAIIGVSWTNWENRPAEPPAEVTSVQGVRYVPPTPTPIPLPPKPIETQRLDTGLNYSCAIDANADIACWGDVPASVGAAPAGPFIEIAVGRNHACGIRANAHIQCWGSGLLATATADFGVELTALASGDFHTCGVLTDSTMACWGNTRGSPARAPDGAFLDVSANGYTTCGLATDGSIYCPVLLIGEAPPPRGAFVQLSVGLLHSCAVAEGGTVTCWGSNGSGQSAPPADLFSAVSAGVSHSCGLLLDARVKCWGDNSEGKATPPDGEFVQVVAENFHTCGIRADGTLACWGRNHFGEASPPEGLFR